MTKHTNKLEKEFYELFTYTNSEIGVDPFATRYVNPSDKTAGQIWEWVSGRIAEKNKEIRRLERAHEKELQEVFKDGLKAQGIISRSMHDINDIRVPVNPEAGNTPSSN